MNLTQKINQQDISLEKEMETVEIMKKEGNEFFKNQQYKEAIENYENVLTSLPMLLKDEKTKEIKIQCKLNILMCMIKQKKYYDGIVLSDEILSLDKNCVKAIYRKGLCFEKINEFEKSEECYQNVLSIEKTDHIVSKLKDIRFLKKKQMDKEKKVYKRVLDKMDLYPEKTVERTVEKSRGYWFYFSMVIFLFLFIFKFRNKIFSLL
jgi:tetratricopeptide (TPR) repeat protein